ncbi:dihydroxyacetone kinase subunit DhaK [Microbacterium sp. F2E]|uniref:dihydroxyacetone kinase subunit DhaK n=1 Tax=Microbacterium sp. F2E TaxID=2895284 RepID=UPI001E65308A|nr:dihydroxyacetone kinase subunit DhaK [Microbacterium sp. F2E]MCC9053135.1 dihydroxyacetone kinase subunit DhaK [Microbacterium sp. F2E]
MKKLINSPDTVVADALRGVAAAHPELTVDHENRLVISNAPRENRVALISGGGSGHEPLHSGFVGAGMLDAACAGEIFTSPTPDQMLAAAQAVDSGAGVLFIVKNYTGDVLNFEMAAELAGDENIQTASVVVADDVAVQDSTYTAGRRGVGTTVIVEKIAGAAAAEGKSLAEVAAIAEKVSSAGRSMGVALTSCTVPAVGHPSFDLPDDEMEVGVGIHGEPGRKRVPLEDAKGIAHDIVTAITDDLDFTGAPVIALLSGLGGTPLIELYVVYADIAAALAERGIEVARVLVGDYITSLDMAGCSLTLVRADDEMLRLWDAPVNTTALRWGV